MTERIIIAADDMNAQATLALASTIGRHAYAVKIHEVYDSEGPPIVARIKEAGAKKVWMDAKLHDIPNTVRLRAKAYADAGIDIITVHASGGVAMMRAAKEVAGAAEIYAVTVLTSLSEEEAVGIYNKPIQQEVLALAYLAKEAGVDGVVCSPQEVGMLASDSALSGLKFVIPSTRSPGADVNDQKRVTTPREAMDAGATYLVIGRQVTKAADPVAALAAIEAEIA